MSRILVDTDWIIDALNGQRPALATLDELAADGLLVSTISYGELYQGAHYARDPAPALSALRVFFEAKGLVAVTGVVAERFAVVRGALPRPLRQQIGDLDLLIAATALTYGVPLLTRNLRDFRLVPGLDLHRPTSA